MSAYNVMDLALFERVVEPESLIIFKGKHRDT